MKEEIKKLLKKLEKSDLEKTFSILMPIIKTLGITVEAKNSSLLAPNLRMALYEATEGAPPWGEGVKQVAAGITSIIELLEDKKGDARVKNLREELLALFLVVLFVLSQQIVTTGLGPLPGDEADKKAARLFTLDLLFSWMIKGEFTEPLLSELCAVLEVDEKKTPQVHTLFQAVITAFLIETLPESKRWFVEWANFLEKELQTVNQALVEKIKSSGADASKKGLLALKEAIAALEAKQFQGYKKALNRLFALAEITEEKIQKDLKQLSLLKETVESAMRATKKEQKLPHITVTQA